MTLQLSAKIQDSRRGILCIHVSDTGIGIESDKVNLIFEKFTRGIPSNTNQYTGTGLGLYVIKKFVDDLEGDLHVESIVGEGSCFSVMLPFKIPLLEADECGPSIDERFESPLENMSQSTHNIAKNQSKSISDRKTVFPFQHKILLIEDDKICLLGEKNLLLSLTKHVDVAESAAQAKKLLESNHYDVVISDFGLPDGSGIDIVKTIRNQPAAKNAITPFIALTAHKSPVLDKAALEAGFNEISTKPLTLVIAQNFLLRYPVPTH